MSTDDTERPLALMTAAQRHRYELDRAPIHAESPRRFVTVDRDARGEVTVRLRPDSLQRLTEKQLTEEITAAFQAALDEYDRTSRRLLTELVG
ncbi:hypothetical protein ACIA8K_25830 [Catenuloplanes sp. NPDC051500]|uniref:hypothetical protein n=1 Tax=Catenuloplanes sp. NPDC051500 TaxID=3363959 RepID=UPI0037BDAAAC